MKVTVLPAPIVQQLNMTVLDHTQTQSEGKTALQNTGSFYPWTYQRGARCRIATAYLEGHSCLV
jgi:hypothetical protein